MNEELKIIIRAITAEAQRNIEKVRKELENVDKQASKTGKTLEKAMDAISKGGKLAVTGIVALTTAMVALGKSSIEFQKQYARLLAGFQSTGASVAQATKTYKELFSFLGDNDVAIEAANQLAQLTQNEKDLAEWTSVLQGVYAKFPSSLPIESLAEAANETAKTGALTGALADALNWVGYSEEAFQAQLDATTSAQEREALIRSTLNNLYSGASQIYANNNQALIEYNRSQANLNIALADATRYATPLLTAFNNLAVAALTNLKPAFETVASVIIVFTEWIVAAISAVGAFFGMISSESETTTDSITGIKASIDKVGSSVGSVANSFQQANKEAEKLKRQTMGFDELNVITPQASTASGGGGNGGIGGANGGGVTVPDISDALNSANLDTFKEKLEGVRDIMEEYKPLILGILGTTAAWKLFQAGWKFFTGEDLALFTAISAVIKGIGKAWGWLTTVIALVKEGNSIWAVLATAFPKVASAITSIGGVFAKVGSAIAGVAKAVGAFIGGLTGGQIAIIIAVIAAVASAVYFLWKNWDAVIEKIKEFGQQNLVPILNEFKDIFTQLWDAIKMVGQAFADLGLAIWNAIPEEVRQWFADIATAIWGVITAVWEWIASIEWLKIIGTVFEWIGGIIVGIVGGVIAGAIQGVLNLLESVVQGIVGILQSLAGIVSTVVYAIVGLFTGDFSKCLDAAKLIWTGIKNVFFSVVDSLLGTVWGLVEGIIDFFLHMWDVLVGHSIVPDTIEAIIEWFLELPKNIFRLMADFVKTVINKFIELATSAGSWAVNMWTKVKQPFIGVGSWFKNIFKQAWDGIKSIWSGVGSFFNGVWSTIKGIFSRVGTSIADGVTGAVKGAVNSVLSSVGNKINGFIGLINGSLDVINKIPGVNIGKISKLSVPQLAKGGIANSATLALFGEAGKEAVLPLENNTEWMDILAERIASRNSAPSKIVLQLDGRELGWANIKTINGITEQTGSLQLKLV